MATRKKTEKAAVKEEQTVQEQPVQEQAAQEQAAQEQTEQPVQEEAVTLTKAEFEQVRAHIEQLQKERDEAVAVAQRLQADFDNFRKRNANVRSDSFDDGMRECIKDILPALDNFERAMETAAAPDEAWAAGVQLVFRQFTQILEAKGLKELPAEGTFDPNYHNAVMQEAVEGKESGEILAVLQKGYEVKGKIIRYSMVKVAE